MKKTFCAVICLILLFCFSGCNLPFGARAVYRENVQQAISVMDQMETPLYENCALMLDVWHHAIFQKHDKATDPYTVRNGRMTDDFNVALERLYSDSKFSDALTKLQRQQQDLRTLLHELEKPPAGFESFNETLTALIDDHITLTCVLIDLKGSYNEISEQVGSLEKAINDNIRELFSYEKELNALRS